MTVLGEMMTVLMQAANDDCNDDEGRMFSFFHLYSNSECSVAGTRVAYFTPVRFECK